MDRNYTLPIDLATNSIPFDAKSIVKVYLKSKFGLYQQDSENISLCVKPNVTCESPARVSSVKVRIFFKISPMEIATTVKEITFRNYKSSCIYQNLYIEISNTISVTISILIKQACTVIQDIITSERIERSNNLLAERIS